MATSIGAAGDRIDVLRGIPSGIESKSGDLLVPRMLTPTPNAPGEGKVKTITAGHMGDGGSVDAFKSSPGETIRKADPLVFAPVSYACEYRKLFDLVPSEEARADEELPEPMVALRSKNLMGTLLRNRDLALVTAITGTTWGTVTDLSAGGGANQFDKSGADPIDVLVGTVDAIPGGANTIVFGADTWRYFSTHPNVLSALDTTRDRAILDPDRFASAIGEKLGLPNVITYKLRVSNGAPLDAVTPATTVRRMSKQIWIGQVSNTPGIVGMNARGLPEVTMNATALAFIQEADIAYKEAESINPEGRQMTVGMSYDILPVTTALGARLDAVVS